MDEEEQEEFKQDMLESVKAQYTDLLRVTDLDNTLVCSLLKLSKIAVEIQCVSDAYRDDAIDLEAMEALIRIEVLLGAAGEVRGEIKKAL